MQGQNADMADRGEVARLLTLHMNGTGATVESFHASLRRAVPQIPNVTKQNLYYLLAGELKFSNQDLELLLYYLRDLPTTLTKAYDQAARERISSDLFAYMKDGNLTFQQLEAKMKAILPGRPALSYKTLGRFLSSQRDKERSVAETIEPNETKTADRTVELCEAFLNLESYRRSAENDAFAALTGNGLALAYGSQPFYTTATYTVSTDQSTMTITALSGASYCILEERFPGAVFDGVFLRIDGGYIGVLRNRQYRLPRMFCLRDIEPTGAFARGCGSSVPLIGEPQSFNVTLSRS